MRLQLTQPYGGHAVGAIIDAINPGVGQTLIDIGKAIRVDESRPEIIVETAAAPIAAESAEAPKPKPKRRRQRRVSNG